MTEILQVHYLSSNTRTCFFYRRNLKPYFENMDYVQAIKLEFGYEYSRTTFGSLYLQPHSDVPDKCIGVSCLFATRLGLKENDTILISNVSPPAIEAVQIIPRREEDYVVLVSKNYCNKNSK